MAKKYKPWGKRHEQGIARAVAEAKALGVDVVAVVGSGHVVGRRRVVSQVEIDAVAAELVAANPGSTWQLVPAGGAPSVEPARRYAELLARLPAA